MVAHSHTDIIIHSFIVSSHIHARSCSHSKSHTHAYTCQLSNKHMCTPTWLHRHSHFHTLAILGHPLTLYTHIHGFIHSRLHRLEHVHTHTQSHTQSLTHTDTHTVISSHTFSSHRVTHTQAHFHNITWPPNLYPYTPADLHTYTFRVSMGLTLTDRTCRSN